MQAEQLHLVLEYVELLFTAGGACATSHHLSCTRSAGRARRRCCDEGSEERRAAKQQDMLTGEVRYRVLDPPYSGDHECLHISTSIGAMRCRVRFWPQPLVLARIAGGAHGPVGLCRVPADKDVIVGGCEPLINIGSRGEDG